MIVLPQLVTNFFEVFRPSKFEVPIVIVSVSNYYNLEVAIVLLFKFHFVVVFHVFYAYSFFLFVTVFSIHALFLYVLVFTISFSIHLKHRQIILI